MFKDPYTVDFSARKDALADPMFVHRWSPRSFEKVQLSQETLEKIFDAVRFGPSAFNAQPWRIFASQADGSDFDRFLSLLVERNQKWAHNAAVIGFILAQKNREHRQNQWAIYDCGFAWASLTFQANQLGLYTHGMAGIKKDEIYQQFAIPREAFEVIAGFAIGKLAPPDQLAEAFREREHPSKRKDLAEIYFPGGAQLSAS